MILSCPSCGVQYFAEEASIGDAGRTVRCASCGETWHAAPRQPQTELGAHEAYRRKVSQTLRQSSRRAALGVWTAAALLAVIGTAAAIGFRNEVARAWPESAGAFRALGFEVNRFGLEFAETEAQRTFDGTTPVLSVSGRVVSVEPAPRAAPLVRIGLRDETGREVADVLARLEPDPVPAEGEARFSAVIENPPVEAFEIELSFETGDAPPAVAATSGAS